MRPILKFAVALAVVLAVATVLITPDPTDDVEGVLLRTHQPVVHAVFHAISSRTLQSFASRFLPAVYRDLSAHRSQPADLLDLVCVRLC